MAFPRLLFVIMPVVADERGGDEKQEKCNDFFL